LIEIGVARYKILKTTNFILKIPNIRKP
jgi:hypothetical protein